MSKARSPLVSVVIPTYNRMNLLFRALNSVFAQTLSDFEIIVVDDGSTDDTQQVIEQFQKAGSQFRYILQEHSGGAAAPKNRGIREAQGRYIATLDSDDEWLPEKLAKQVALFERIDKKDIGFIGCNMRIVEKEGEREYRIPRYQNPLWHMLANDYMGTGSCMMYRKDVFEDVGLFDETLKSGQDKEMRLRLLAQGYQFDFVNEALVLYHKEADGISAAHLTVEQREQDWNYVFKKYKTWYARWPEAWSEKLRYDGTRYMLLGLHQKARSRFLQSVKKNFWNWRSYLYYGLSFFGTGLYEQCTQWKQHLPRKK